MSARSALAALVRDAAPETWDVIDHPKHLPPFDDARKPVAIVIEQRTYTAGRFSPDGARIPIDVALLVWVVVDGSRGDDEGDLEDELEAAAEQMIQILEPLQGHAWDGTATRDNYDEQKPAYQFPIAAPGDLTPEE